MGTLNDEELRHFRAQAGTLGTANDCHLSFMRGVLPPKFANASVNDCELALYKITSSLPARATLNDEAMGSLSQAGYSDGTLNDRELRYFTAN